MCEIHITPTTKLGTCMSVTTEKAVNIKDTTKGSIINYGVAAKEDLPVVAKIVEEALPSVAENINGKWNKLLGQGTTWDEQILITASLNDTIVGVAWVEPAAMNDTKYYLPWWCINILAVKPEFQGLGIGANLLTYVIDLAASKNVTSVYGLCDTNVVSWYKSQGLATTGPGGSLDTNVLMEPDVFLKLRSTANECYFFTDAAGTPGLPRIHEYV